MKINIHIEAEEQDLPRLSILFSGLDKPGETVLVREAGPEALPEPEPEQPRLMAAPTPSLPEVEGKVAELYDEVNRMALANQISGEELTRVKWKIVDLLWDVVCVPAVLEILGSVSRKTLLGLAFHDDASTRLWQVLHVRKELLAAVLGPRILRMFRGALGSLNHQARKKKTQ